MREDKQRHSHKRIQMKGEIFYLRRSNLLWGPAGRGYGIVFKVLYTSFEDIITGCRDMNTRKNAGLNHETIFANTPKIILTIKSKPPHQIANSWGDDCIDITNDNHTIQAP